MCFTLACQWVFSLQGTNFFRIIIGEVVALVKCLCKWKPFLVSCGQILEPCTDFRDLKWGIEFWLRSEIGYEKSQILY